MSEWQPIETAPKDGTEIILWESRKGHRWLAFWHVDCWVTSGSAEAGNYNFPVFTHWQPLPSPPKEQESGQ